MYCEKGVLKYFSKFTGNLLCQRVVLKKVAGVGSFQKNKLRHKCFLVNFDHLWLLLALTPTLFLKKSLINSQETFLKKAILEYFF